MNFIEAQEILRKHQQWRTAKNYESHEMTDSRLLTEALDVVINYKVEIPQNEIEDELKQYTSNTFKVDFNLGVRWAIQKLSDKLCQKEYKPYAEKASE